MAISNNNVGIRPGVCTSTTRPTVPYQGQMIFETDTNLSYVYGGSAWQQIAGGTAVGNSGLVYVTSATIGTGVSSVTVSGAFSTTYDNYKIVVVGGVASTTVDFKLTLGSTVTGYYETSLYNTFNAGTAQGLALTNVSEWRYIGAGTTSTLMGDIEVYSPFLPKVSMVKSNMISYSASGLSMFTQGFLDNSTSYTAFTIGGVAGTWTGGTVTVYGYRK